MSKNAVYRFNREHIKKSDMIGGYGAGEELVKNQLKVDLKEMYFDGIEKIFYQAQDNVTPMVSVLKETFQSLWDEDILFQKYSCLSVSLSITTFICKYNLSFSSILLCS